MSALSFQIEGQGRLEHLFERADKLVRQRLLDVLEFIGGEMQAKMLASERAQLQRKSGKLERGFYHRIYVRQGGQQFLLVTGVGKRAFYAAFQEKGVDATEGDVRVYRGRSGRRLRGGAKKRTVHLTARPFIHPTFESMRAEIIADMTALWRKDWPMPALSREAAVAALYARLTSAAGLAALIVTFSRAYKLPTEVQVEQQPALFLVTTMYDVYNPAGGQRPQQLAHPLTQIIHCNAIVYASQQPDDTNPEGNLLNPIVDAIEQAIKFQPGVDPADERGTQFTNLGGLVESVTFSTDPIALVTGTGSLQATILVPLQILITQGRT